jgi:hypothetical protein
MNELKLIDSVFKTSTGGSVVECSPATRAARVRFPASAFFLFKNAISTSLFACIY